jgi:hypothetical protein
MPSPLATGGKRHLATCVNGTTVAAGGQPEIVIWRAAPALTVTGRRKELKASVRILALRKVALPVRGRMSGLGQEGAVYAYH